MKATISKEKRSGWPAQVRPDSKLPEPWSQELLVAFNHLHHHSLSPDGKYIAFIWQREGNSDIWLMNSNGNGWPQRLTYDRPEQTFWNDEKPGWSPDSSCIVYVARGDIWTVSREGGRSRRLTDYKHGDSSPIFSPDGTRIYFLSGRKDFHKLCWTTVDGDWPVALTKFEADVSDPQPSPDGSRLAFVYHPQEDLNRSEICTIASDGGEVKHLTGKMGVWDSRPRWSPGGRQIAFLSNRSGWRELYLLEIGSGQVKPLTSGVADVHDFNWKSDGQEIALVINHQGTADLYLLDLKTTELRLLRGGGAWHNRPQWGRDDVWLTVEAESPVETPEIYRINLKNGKSSQLTFSLPPALAKAKLVTPEFIEYASTGNTTIPGFLFRPEGSSEKNPCPAVVYPHGGPTDEHALYWEMLPQWLVAKGYAVLAPNYRGSTGYGLTHQHALHNNWGIVDKDDMLAAADYLAGLDWVDGGRLGIYGASYGSYLAVLALARDKQRYKCGVAKFGDGDILTSWAQGDRPGREDLERQMGHPTNNLKGYQVGSPVYDAANIQAPLLIFHGEEDERVHPKQSEQLVETLEKEGKTFEYYLYEGEGHGFLQKGNVLHFYATLERFLDWYLI
jgi:dipeptidyl aminopeptidase/acylaminoacyl peptidase